MATKNKANSLVGNILGGNTEPKMQEEKAPVAAPVRVAADEERPSTEKGTKEGETRARLQAFSSRSGVNLSASFSRPMQAL